MGRECESCVRSFARVFRAIDAFKDALEAPELRVAGRAKTLEEYLLAEVKPTEEEMREILKLAESCVEFAKFSLNLFHELVLENPNDLESGLFIKAQPPGKKLLNIDSMSGGEKTLTAFTFLFAIQRYRPSPFYILDEADAALDKNNTKKISNLIKKQSDIAQFIVISHNDSLVSEADHVYGVSMEDGESKIIGVKLPKNGNNMQNN